MKRDPDASRRPPGPADYIPRGGIHLVDSLLLAQTAGEILRENKAENVLILEVPQSLWITDYFVIATGRSTPHLEFLRKEIKATLESETERRPTHTEGTADQEWVLVDYEDVILHLFTEERRAYYDLEGLWADAEVVSA